MSLRQYLIVVGMGTLVGLATWLVVLFTVNPNEAGWLGFLLFYLSLAVSLVGFISLIGFAVRMVLYHHDEIVLREVTAAFRQACFFTMVVVGSIFLQSHKLLAWWNVLLLIVVLATIELFIASARFVRRP